MEGEIRRQALTITLTGDDLEYINEWYLTHAHEMMDRPETIEEYTRLRSLLDRLGFKMDSADYSEEMEWGESKRKED